MREICKEKVKFTLTFYLKQNKEVQLDLKHFEIFLHLFITFAEFTAWENVRRVVNIWICVI